MDFNKIDSMVADWLNVDWDSVPLDDDGRYAAGKVRDFSEFYAIENRSKAMQVERFLTRYSAMIEAGKNR